MTVAFPAHEGVLMDEPGEAFPTILPLGGLLLAIAVWLTARISRIRDACRYDVERQQSRT